MAWSYVGNGYNISINDSFKEGYYYTSRHLSDVRPLEIWSGDEFWGVLLFAYKCTVVPLGYSGFWVRGYSVANNNWQTAVSDPLWLPMSSAYRNSVLDTHPHRGVYSPGSVANGVVFDGYRVLELGFSNFNPDWSQGIVIAQDQDAEVFKNRLFSYSFDTVQPTVARV